MFRWFLRSIIEVFAFGFGCSRKHLRKYIPEPLLGSYLLAAGALADVGVTYSFGSLLLSMVPWPPKNFFGLLACAFVVLVLLLVIVWSALMLGLIFRGALFLGRSLKLAYCNWKINRRSN